ncbi:MAG: DUF2605 domain-containing protein [Cyanobacteriota bacterium]|nr:DUF2605 domain-containing protein [Cyanobacteriota bacterium]
MLSPNLPEPELLKTILLPLLEDFQYWFGRSCNLLETEDLSFLNQEEQAQMLDRIKQAQKEVAATKTLFEATDGRVGVEMPILLSWHKLLTECWQTSTRFRLEQSKGAES